MPSGDARRPSARDSSGRLAGYDVRGYSGPVHRRAGAVSPRSTPPLAAKRRDAGGASHTGSEYAGGRSAAARGGRSVPHLFSPRSETSHQFQSHYQTAACRAAGGARYRVSHGECPAPFSHAAPALLPDGSRAHPAPPPESATRPVAPSPAVSQTPSGCTDCMAADTYCSDTPSSGFSSSVESGGLAPRLLRSGGISIRRDASVPATTAHMLQHRGGQRLGIPYLTVYHSTHSFYN